jgi:4-amino-4-deoxy-L-arabinose transferase-like glycosyltransferase
MTEARQVGDRMLALAVGTLVVGALYLTANRIGYARDEGGYWQASSVYGHWLEMLWAHPDQALAEGAINDHFRVNAEHPALMKLLFATSRLVLHQWLHLIPTPGLALRFPAMLMSGLATGLVVLWGARAVSRPAGVVAGLLFITMPRVFHHAHLACFDVPVVATLLLTIYAYFMAITTRAWSWVFAVGICYGLALDTKHNAWTLPAVLLAHLLLTEGRTLMVLPVRQRWQRALPLISMLTLGPLVLILLWPWLWFNTLEKLRYWFEFHLRHDYYNMEFLGRTYHHRPPMPRGYAWVMTAATVPLTTLVLSGIGIFVSIKHALRSGSTWQRLGSVAVWRRQGQANVSTADGLAVRPLPAAKPPSQSTMAPAPWDTRRSNDALWLFGILAAYAPWLLTTTPIFGGTKHWLPAYPFICLFAARGYALFLARLREQLKARAQTWRWRIVSSVATLACLSAPVVITADSLPFGLSAYTPLVGGAPGAATLGLNRTFWGYTTLELAEPMSQLLPNGGRVYVHDTALPSWEIYQHDGTLSPKLVPTLNIAQSNLALYHYEPHMGRVEYQIWEAYRTTSPEVITTFDGVPVAWLYARPGTGEKLPTTRAAE